MRADTQNPISKILNRLAAMLLLVVIAACQTAEGEGGEEKATEVPKNLQPGEVVGDGPVRIAMLLHRSGQAYDQKLATAYLQGAKLAVDDLGSEHVTLPIEDSGSVASRIKELTRAEAASQMLVLPGDKQSVEAALTVPRPGDRPVIALGEFSGNFGNRVYWFLPSWIEEMEAAAEYADRLLEDPVAAALVVPRSVDMVTVSALANRVSKYTSTIELVQYNPGSGADSIGTRNKEVIGRANTLLFVGDHAEARILLGELRRLPEAQNVKVVFVESQLAKLFTEDAGIAGAIAAMQDESSLRLIRDRYDKAYSEVMPIEAAYAYDAVAIAAGLARSKITGGLSRTTLQNPKGFRGASGSFRFHSDGRVERLFRIAQIRDGKIETLEKPAAGF